MRGEWAGGGGEESPVEGSTIGGHRGGQRVEGQCCRGFCALIEFESREGSGPVRDRLYSYLF